MNESVSETKTLWVGCCCAYCEKRAQKVGDLVIRGLKVGWTIQPVTIGRCQCNAWKGPQSDDRP
jgi:hypothetical protein